MQSHLFLASLNPYSCQVLKFETNSLLLGHFAAGSRIGPSEVMLSQIVLKGITEEDAPGD